MILGKDRGCRNYWRYRKHQNLTAENILQGEEGIRKHCENILSVQELNCSIRKEKKERGLAPRDPFMRGWIIPYLRCTVLLMCILAYVTHHSPRFPLILVSNRDELLSRGTRPVGLDPHTSLLWAADETAGGSWLGVHALSGRFAVLTNCARAPAAPLRAPVVGRRGAAPLAETVRRTRAHAAPRAAGCRGGGGTNVSLEFVPDLSRGLILRDFLAEGKLPGAAAEAEAEAVPPSLRPPYYAGYNLITTESLFNTQELQLHYTTNRSGAQHAAPTTHGAVHCLSNTYLDNWSEPKSKLLKSLFEESLKLHIPRDRDAYNADAVATSLADYCLCAQPEFNILRELKDPSLPAETRQQYKELLEYGVPHLGYKGEEELTELYGKGLQTPLHFPQDAYIERANSLQRNIFVNNPTYGTRTQTVVVVEQDTPSGKVIVHFSQRECRRDGAPHKAWSHFTLPS